VYGINIINFLYVSLLSVLWRCYMGVSNGIQPAK